MCGIVGILSKFNTMSYYMDGLFTSMLQFDSIRGPDSTGVFGVTRNGHVDYVKGDADGYVFTHSKNYLDFKARMKDYAIVIGHNRKATTGSITASNAHPFQEQHIIMVHNGTLRTTKDLANTEVDSQAIAKALAEHDPVKALSLLDGAYALVWYDQNEKTLNLARNKERPLSLLEYDSSWIISSEIGLPLWLQGRDNRRVVVRDSTSMIRTVPEQKILVFKLDKLDQAPSEVSYEEYKRWAPPVYMTPTRSTWPQTSSVATVRSSTDGRVINMSASSNSTSSKVYEHKDELKQGNRIVFEFDDTKTEEGAEVLLGYPVFDNVKDENIVVRYVLKKGEAWEPYFNGLEPRLWTGEILHYREMLHVQTVYVRNIKKYEAVEDAQGEKHERSELEQALDKELCNKCQSKVTLEQVGFAIARKKSDGKWRIVCPKCLSSSIEAAQERNPQLRLPNAN